MQDSIVDDRLRDSRLFLESFERDPGYGGSSGLIDDDLVSRSPTADQFF